jgi:hypothetical protein
LIYSYKDNKNWLTYLLFLPSFYVELRLIEQQGHYFLSVKGNQAGLEEDLEQAFRKG